MKVNLKKAAALAGQCLAATVKLDHAKLRDAALDEAGKAEKAMLVADSQSKLANLWRTYVYLTWLAERHDDWYQQEVKRREVVEVTI